VVRLVRIVTLNRSENLTFILVNLYIMINTFRHGINFIVYCVFNNIFREVAFETFKIRRG
jgi:hypothetical protein